MLARGVQVERYVVEDLVGVGGMAEVWSARHVILGTRRALKRLVATRAGRSDALIREGQVQARLDHPNILPVLDVLQVGGDTVLVLPLVEGPSLAALLDRGPVPLELGAALLLGVVAGMHAAHASGVVHRDLKPGNVLLDRRDGTVVPRVADFGIAEDASSASRGSGTPRYTAPETVLGHPVDVRSDFYALGRLFEDVFGPANVPDAIAQVMRALVCNDPAERLADVQPVQQALAIIADVSLLQVETPFGVWVRDGFRRAGSPSQHTAPTRARNVTEQTRPPQVQLPVYRNTFVGRQDARTRIAQALSTDRLVSLTGPGGVGKTRLAIAVGEDICGRYPGGLWFLDLSQTTDAGGIARVAARALDVPLLGQDQDEQAAIDAVSTRLKSRDALLLVVDNAEHVRAAAASAVTRWLDAAPAVTVLCTSQVPLGARGERIVGVEPLGVGESTPGDAAALFVARAQLADGALVLRPETLPFVQQIVQAVDGLPLAIELAAARVRVLGVERLAQRLSDQFRVLRTRHADRPERHRTLRATLDWSWALLDEDERHVLVQLSVFRGSFSLEAAEAVATSQSPDFWVDDILSSLVDKSWVRSWTPSGETSPRLGLLRAVQAYAAERVTDDAAVRRHGLHYTSLGTVNPADTFDVRGGPARRVEWQRDIDNVVAATRQAIERGDGSVASAGARLVWALTASIGPFGLGIELLTAANELLPSTGLWVDLASAHWRNGDVDTAGALFARALEHADTPRTLAEAASPYVGLLWGTGQLERSRQVLDRVLPITEAHDLHRLRGVALSNGMVLEVMQGAPDAGVAAGQAALKLHRRVGDARAEARTSMNLGVVALRLGHQEQADEWLNQALSAHAAIDNRHGMAFTLGNLASLHLDAGDLNQALRYVQRALRLSRELGDGVHQTRFNNYLARVHARRGEPALAQAALRESAAFADAQDDDVLRAFHHIAAAWVAHAAGEWETLDGQVDAARALVADQPEDGVVRTDIEAVRTAPRDATNNG